MGLVKIMEKASDSEIEMFENDIYDLKEIAMELCDAFETMKARFGERSGMSMRRRSGYRRSE